MARDLTTLKPSHDQAQVSLTNLQRPPDPERYKGLRTGPELVLELEPNQATPVDASNSLLRTLSPFTIQVEPPLVLASEPTSGADPEVKKSSITGLYGAATQGRTGFLSARASLAMTTYVLGNYGPGTADEVIARHSGARSSGGSRHSSGDGVQKRDSSGIEEPGKTGEPAIADLQTAVDIATQLKATLETPPLVLLINPQTLSMTYTKIQAFQDRTRFGYIFHAWGEDQPRLSISAKCGAFMSGGRGVQFASKRDSAAWQNLMTAFQFYRNNGYIYDTVGKSNAHHLVGALSIRYDQWIYFGSMQTFSMSLDESSTQLGGVTFDMEFVVSAMVDTASPSFNVQPMRKPNPDPMDPRYSGRENQAFNRPGEFSVVQATVGVFGQAIATLSEGQQTPHTAQAPIAYLSNFRPGTTQSSPPPSPGPATRPVGTGGFRSAESAPVAAVSPATPQKARPFKSPGDDELVRSFLLLHGSR